MSKLSVVITVHNSQSFITDCIKSVNFADEVIVVDNESSDQTVEIAKGLGVTLYSHKNNPRLLNESKNFGFKKASFDWILSLDSDERVEADLRKEIKYLLNQDNLPFNGYKIPRHNIIFGKVIKHGLWYPDYQLRLFKKGKGAFPNIHNHELLKIDGEAGKLKGHIEHLNYQSVSQYIQKIDKQYSDNEVTTFLDKGGQIQWYDALRFPLQDFLSNYFARQGYKDGLHGLVLSLLQAFYMFIVFAKIWEKQGFQETKIPLDKVHREMTRGWRQINHWYLQEHSGRLNLLQKVWLKLLQKFA